MGVGVVLVSVLMSIGHISRLRKNFGGMAGRWLLCLRSGLLWCLLWGAMLNLRTSAFPLTHAR